MKRSIDWHAFCYLIINVSEKDVPEKNVSDKIPDLDFLRKATSSRILVIKLSSATKGSWYEATKEKVLFVVH